MRLDSQIELGFLSAPLLKKQFDVLVMTMEEEGGGKVKLGLGIGVDCYGDDHNGTEEVVVGKKKKKYGGGGLTASQLHELEQQALIYKHFAANLPVPFHLVLPIWKSVAASFGSSNAAAINRQYPSCKSNLFPLMSFNFYTN